MMLVDTDTFGESVTYKPQGAANVAINAVVHRFGAEEALPGSGGISAGMEILVRNHATKGVESVNEGGDKINVADRKGGTAADHLVVKVIEQDAGAWRLRVV